MKKYEVYTDGASRGNPGPSSCAFLVLLNGDKVVEKAEYLGLMTNNQAEYMGIIRALEKLIEMKANNIIIYSDSELVVRQLNHEYKVRNEDLKKLYGKVQSMLLHLFPIKFQHIVRSENVKADFLCNQALDQIQTHK